MVNFSSRHLLKLVGHIRFNLTASKLVFLFFSIRNIPKTFNLSAEIYGFRLWRFLPWPQRFLLYVTDVLFNQKFCEMFVLTITNGNGLCAILANLVYQYFRSCQWKEKLLMFFYFVNLIFIISYLFMPN